ncbi:MAG: right-handed parallel beta-helix repeat-containing protein, partial [Promethearchaeota archaeon]
MIKPSYKRRIPFLVKIGLFILIFGSVSIFFTSQNLASNYYIESATTNEITTLSKTMNPRASVTHDPIFIDGDDGGNDWTTFPNKTGSGTFGDPYIIENLEINASGSGSGIYIRDSTVYAEIINCTVSNSGPSSEDAGIRLLNCANIQIMNCTSAYNDYYGIYLVSNSYNNTLSGNNASYNSGYGIYLTSSSNNTLSGNIANHNNHYGIVLWSSCNSNTLSENIADSNLVGIILYSSFNNKLTENIANYNNGNGIYLASSDNNTLSGNEVSYNNVSGIILYSSDNNSFSGNLASDNYDIGILLSSSNNNLFSENDASYNSYYGIYLTSSNNNTFFLNILLENTDEAASCDDSFYNMWDNGTHGNYWGNIKEKYPAATNDLTIWNTPYQIDENNIDNYPLATMDASVGINSNPTISESTDLNFYSGEAKQDISWTIWDNDVVNPYYNITQNGTQIQTGSWVPGNPISINMSTLDSLPLGNYIFLISVYDGLGGFVTDSVIVSVTDLRTELDIKWGLIIGIILGIFVLVGGSIIVIRKNERSKLISEDKDNEVGDGSVSGNAGEGSNGTYKEGVNGKRAHLSSGAQTELETQQTEPTSEIKLPTTIKE